MERAITRDEAIETLNALLDSGILAEDTEEKVQEIVDAIDNEKLGLHMWGAEEEEYAVLYTAVSEDMRTEEYIENGRRIWQKYSFVPSSHEAEEIAKNIEEA